MSSYEHLSTKQVKCSKPHTCEWCGEGIAQGDLADYRAYKYEGDFNSDYMHPECSEGSRLSRQDEDLREDFLDFGFESGAQFRGGLLGSREAAAWQERYGKPTPPEKD